MSEASYSVAKDRRDLIVFDFVEFKVRVLLINLNFEADSLEAIGIVYRISKTFNSWLPIWRFSPPGNRRANGPT